VVDLSAVSKAFASLFGFEPSVESFARVLQSPEPHSNKGILFIFDNFETMADVTGLHKFLDEHTLRWSPEFRPRVKMDFCRSAVDKKEQTYESKTQTTQGGL
jgi:hypothetical protein